MYGVWTRSLLKERWKKEIGGNIPCKVLNSYNTKSYYIIHSRRHLCLTRQGMSNLFTLVSKWKDVNAKSLMCRYIHEIIQNINRVIVQKNNNKKQQTYTKSFSLSWCGAENSISQNMWSQKNSVSYGKPQYRGALCKVGWSPTVRHHCKTDTRILGLEMTIT